MKSKFGLVLLFALIFGFTYGQANTIKPLKIGDKVPDILLENVFNYSSKSFRVSDLKGKLIILDFWNIACTPCIKAIPKMEHLQQMFGNKIQVLLVNTTNSLQSLNKSLVSEKNKSLGFPKSSRIQIIRETKLPFVIQPHAFDDLFPHPGEPHHVWIDSNGVVIALTSGNSTTATKIEDYFSQKKIVLPLHITSYDLAINDHHSYFQPENKRIFDNIKFSAVITHNLHLDPHDHGFITDSSTHKIVGWRSAGLPLQLLHFTLPAPFDSYAVMPLDKIILNVKDKTAILGPKEDNAELVDNWVENNYFNFEIMLPSSKMNGTREENIELLKKALKQTVETFFGIKTSIEKRKLNCWVLKRTTKENLLKTKGGEAVDLALIDKNKFFIQNGDFRLLLEKFRNVNRLEGSEHPLLNETGFNVEGALILVDMEINAPFDNVQELNKQLKKYGLEIIEAKRTVTVLTVNDSK